MRTYMKIRLKHSPAGCIPKHRKVVVGLGLKRLFTERVIEDTPATRGMVATVPYLVEILETNLPVPTK